MKILDTQQTQSSLPFSELVDAIAKGFKQDFESPLRHHHFIKNEDEQDAVMLLMPAWQQEGWGGIKLVNVVPGNATRGLGAISSSYILFDRKTGAHVLLMDGAELTARRTAAASALAASHLAQPTSSNLLVVGAGRVGRYIPYAYRTVLPIRKVQVYDLNQQHAQKLADELNQNGFEATVEDTLEEAVVKSDIISCATLAKSPIIKGEWLKSGQHIDLIGSFTPEMREVDDETMQRSSIYVDTEHALVESGDLLIPLKNNTIRKEDILDTLINICRYDSRPRKSDNEITLFKGVGTAIEDLAAGILAYKNCMETGN